MTKANQLKILSRRLIHLLFDLKMIFSGLSLYSKCVSSTIQIDESTFILIQCDV